MLKIRRGDTVQVIKGKDRGKKGKVLRIFPQETRAIVEGINLVKKHKRRRSQEEQAGIVNIEAAIQLANLMVLCKSCSKPVRVGFKILQDKTKSRFCKSCGEVI